MKVNFIEKKMRAVIRNKKSKICHLLKYFKSKKIEIINKFQKQMKNIFYCQKDHKNFVKNLPAYPHNFLGPSILQKVFAAFN